MIKPSEVAPASAKLMQELLPKYLDMVRVKTCVIALCCGVRACACVGYC